MKIRNPKVLIGWSVTLLGLLLSLLALLAGAVGLDQNDDWGPARSSMLLVGALMMILPHIKRLLQPITGHLGERMRGTTSDGGASTETENGDLQVRSPSREQQVQRARWISVIAAAALVSAAAVYLWLVSVGRWDEWPSTTLYYHLLSEGFQAGETHMLVDPPDDLLSLPDPYDVESRTGLSYLWDVSLYEGRYFLYWGPTPAIVILLVEPFREGAVADNHLVYLFTLGTIVFLLLILRDIWLNVLPELPAWSFLPAAFAAAFTNPLPWLMTRAAVYEAAISSGQFFFIAGMFFLLRAQIYAIHPIRNFMFGGFFWALAVGSRVTLAPAVIVISLALTFILLKPISTQWEFNSTTMLRAAAMLLPLAAGAVALAWYNYDRFGSILELGHRYQLGRTNKLSDYSRVVTLRNIPQNLFNYFINPMRRIGVFPYLKPTWGKYSIPALRYSAAASYHTEQVAGLLLAAPFTIFAFLPFGRSIYAWWRDVGETRQTPLPSGPNNDQDLRSCYLWFVGAAILTLAPLLLLSVNSMRHEADFVPGILLLAALSYGHLLHLYRYRRIRFIVVGSTVLLVAAGVLVSVLLAITGYNAAFENLNPELFDKLVRFFTL